MSKIQGVRKWHRWIATVIGLQLLLWTLSGLIFTLDEMEVVRGEAFLSEQAPREFAPGTPATPLVPLAEAWRAAGLESARSVATARFEDDRAVATERVTEASGEYRGKPVPAWRVRLDDDRDSHVYVHPITGAITSVRNDTWRRFDFFWMLHVMDYEEREDFHHPLITIVAIGGVLTSLTGLVLTVMLWWARRRGARSARDES